MKVHLVDGTYELFRHYFAVPKSQDKDKQEIGATRGVLNSMLSLLSSGATHVGVATDHVVESFRNELYAYYKTSDGVPEDLLSQFPIVEEALKSLGMRVWAMVEFEADDALAAAAVKAAEVSDVEQVLICTPDKDLSQCVRGDRIVQLDRMRNTTRNEAGVIEKFGVPPECIADYLALVGDTADGYPGLAGFGAKGAAAVLSEFKSIDNIPLDAGKWPSTIRGAKKLSATLQAGRADALLFRTLAQLRSDVDVFDDIDELRWQGPRADFEQMCERFNAPDLFKRAIALAATRG